MDNFTKWNRENKAYLPLLDNTIANERAKSWRAALEHVLSNCILPSGMISETLIRRELGN